MTKPMANKIKKLPQSEKGWLDLFTSIYGKDPTTKELAYFKRYKRIGCVQNT